MDKKILGIAGILGATFFLLRNQISDTVSDTIQKQLALESIKLANFSPGFLSVSFNLLFDLKNLSPISVPIDGLNGNLYFGNTLVYNLVVSDRVVLTANESQRVNFPIEIEYIELASDVVDIIQNGSWKDSIRFTGTLRSGIASFPFDYPILSF